MPIFAPNGDYMEDITRGREDINFIAEWQGQYLTSELSGQAGYCSS